MYSSVKTDRLIEKVITCATDLCNSPFNIPKLDEAFLCDDGFYINNSSQILSNSNSTQTTTSKRKQLISFL